ncbi:hypothetical protein ACC870_37080, partial [Rhizobium ruizarguesonis]
VGIVLQPHRQVRPVLKKSREGDFAPARYFVRGPQEGKADKAGQKTTNPAPGTKPSVRAKRPSKASLKRILRVVIRLQWACIGA